MTTAGFPFELPNPDTFGSDLEDFKFFDESLARLSEIDALELLTLKAHLLLEIGLRAVLAARLGVALSDIPRMGFAILLELAFSGLPWEGSSHVPKGLRLLNKMRNDLAHKLSPGDQTARMREICLTVEPQVPWPDVGLGQLLRYRGSLAFLVGWVNAMTAVYRAAPPALHPRRTKAKEDGPSAGA